MSSATFRRSLRTGIAVVLGTTLLTNPLPLLAAKPKFGSFGVAVENIEPAAHPGDDFFAHVNGKWLESAEIAADMSSAGVGVQLHLKAEADVQKIINDLAAQKAKPDSVEQLVGDLYASWMGTEKLDALGAKPLAPYLASINSVRNHDELVALFGNLHYPTPFSVGIIPDPADTTRYIAYVGEGGLGMPTRDYYLDESERFQAYRAAYLEYIERMMTLAGITDASKRAGEILELETRLAEVHWPPEDSRDIRKIYNPMPAAQLAELVPQVAWQRIFDSVGLGGIDTFLVAQTTALQGTGKLLRAIPVQTWKDYMAFHFINARASHLSSAFDQASFDFHSRTLNGVQQQRERAKRGVQLINGAMGEAVGQVYVQRHFPASHKREMENLVGHLLAAFKERLEKNAWMDETTRKEALVKLAAFEPRVGYPDVWTDYSSLQIKRDDLFGNQLALEAFHWQQQLDRLGKPVDRKLWQMSPQTVNAYYSPLMNQITFPAAFLQPPMFDPNADPAVNYGAIGAVIGHEIGHGFDDQGRRFDAQGRIRDWWSPQADASFSKATGKLGEQYASYEPLEGMHINPALTMGENIGDLGGVEMAYAAYHRYLDTCCNGKAPVINGYTGDQRFFLAYGAGWQRLERDDYLRKKLVSDPHSPPRYRVNGVVRNLDAWYDAFDVTPQHALYLSPEDRVHIW